MLQLGDLRRPRGNRGAVEAAPVVGDEARADFDDQAARVGDRRRHDSSPASRLDRSSVVRSAFADRSAGAGVAGCASSQCLDLEDELAAPFAVHRGNGEDRSLPAERLDERAHARLALALGNEVDLVQHEPARLFGERGIVARELGDDRPRIADGIGLGVERRDVDDVQQHARALQVAQELMAESGAFGRALDEAGDVGDDEAPVRRRRARRRGSARAW